MRYFSLKRREADFFFGELSDWISVEKNPREVHLIQKLLWSTSFCVGGLIIFFPFHQPVPPKNGDHLFFQPFSKVTEMGPFWRSL